VCAGNGTACLGCDGIPFGLKKDRCGICGGNGTSCFVNCDFSKTCAGCTRTLGCIWCDSAKSCKLGAYKDTIKCTSNWVNNCKNIKPPNTVVSEIIADGIIAVIVGSVLFAVFTISFLVGGAIIFKRHREKLKKQKTLDCTNEFNIEAHFSKKENTTYANMDSEMYTRVDSAKFDSNSFSDIYLNSPQSTDPYYQFMPEEKTKDL